MAEINKPGIYTSPEFPSGRFLQEVQELIDTTKKEGGAPSFTDLQSEYIGLSLAESVLLRRLTSRTE